jgi:hypothetical protein
MPYIVVRETKDKNGNVLETQYYKGYKLLANKATDGPMFGFDEVHASRFIGKINADNLIGGDPRLTGCVVKQVPE